VPSRRLDPQDMVCSDKGVGARDMRASSLPSVDGRAFGSPDARPLWSGQLAWELGAYSEPIIVAVPQQPASPVGG